MTTDFEHLRQRLLEERQRVEQEIAKEIELQRSLSALAGEECLAHPGDEGSETFEQEKAFAVQGNLQIIVDEIDHALKKFDQGTYGICDDCGQPIPDERLEIRPQASLCIACKTKAEHVQQAAHGYPAVAPS